MKNLTLIFVGVLLFATPVFSELSARIFNASEKLSRSL